ncbi:MAG TPA: hypothetical protein VIF57_24435 [Polyangia bacterium]|jgi:hypothetical protein
MVTILNVASWGAVAALAVAIAAAVSRRWRLAFLLSRVVAVAGPLVLAASLIPFVVAPLAGDAGSDPSARAATLAGGVSNGLNCGVLAFAAALPAMVVWALARRRVRAGR